MDASSEEKKKKKKKMFLSHLLLLLFLRRKNLGRGVIWRTQMPSIFFCCCSVPCTYCRSTVGLVYSIGRCKRKNLRIWHKKWDKKKKKNVFSPAGVLPQLLWLACLVMTDWRFFFFFWSRKELRSFGVVYYYMIFRKQYEQFCRTEGPAVEGKPSVLMVSPSFICGIYV